MSLRKGGVVHIDFDGSISVEFTERDYRELGKDGIEDRVMDILHERTRELDSCDVINFEWESFE